MPSKEYYSNLSQEQKDALLAKKRAWRKANPEKTKAQDRRSKEKNRPAILQQKKEYKRNNMPRLKSYFRKLRYGITQQQFDALLLQQNNGCAICGRGFGDKTPHVDHDHATGKVRGLLCKSCNTAIGLLGDSEEGVRLALSYLQRVAA